MFDFADIRTAKKDEQIRAWAIEQAVDACRDGGDIITTAQRIETFVKGDDE